MPETRPTDERDSTTGVNSSTLSVLSVLNCFTINNTPLSVAEVSNALGITRNMAFRAVALLASLNYVITDASGRRYQLSYCILDLCNDRTTGLDLRRVCATYMRRIQTYTGETATFSIPVGTTSVVIDGIEGNVGTRLGRVAWGRALPLHGGSAPRAILSCFMDDEIETYLSKTGPLKQRTGKTMPTKRLWREIGKIRKMGYSLSIPEYVDDGSQHISFPIKDMVDRPHGAIAVSGPADRLTMEKIEVILPHVQQLIAELNEQSHMIPSFADSLA